MPTAAFRTPGTDPALTSRQQPQRRRGSAHSTFFSTGSSRYQTCAHLSASTSAPARSARHDEHSAGGSVGNDRSGFASRRSPDPLRPRYPPGFFSFERTRSEACRRPAFRFSFAPIGSFDGGVEEFALSIDTRRRSSATSSSRSPIK